MKYRLFIQFFLFVFQIGYSQTGILIHGKVTNNENPINGTEVINLNTKSATNTDRNGLFSITANPKDVLVFISRNYETKKVFLNENLIDKNDFRIVLTQKNKQLSEVLVTSETKPKYDSRKVVDGKYFDDIQSSPRNRLIYDGSIENGVDFVRIYKDIIKAFRKNQKDNVSSKAIAFKTHILTNYDTAFFAKTLDIKQDQIIPFLEFCEADKKSEMITEESNTLAVLDFLMAKNNEFKEILR